MWDELFSKSGASCLWANFMWGELSWGELSLGRVVLIPVRIGSQLFVIHHFCIKLWFTALKNQY